MNKSRYLILIDDNVNINDRYKDDIPNYRIGGWENKKEDLFIRYNKLIEQYKNYTDIKMCAIFIFDYVKQDIIKTTYISNGKTYENIGDMVEEILLKKVF